MKNKSFLSLALSAFLLITSCSDKEIETSPTKQNKISSSISSRPDIVDPNHRDLDANLQLKANQFIEKIYKTFNKSHNNSINGIADYPPYFGGCFVDTSGKLVVYINGNIANGKKKIAEIIGSEDFTTLPAKHSYKTLLKVMSDLNAFKLNPANKEKSKNFNFYALLEGENQVVIELDEYNDGRIKEFEKNVLKSVAIDFKKSSGKYQLEATLKPGGPAEVDLGVGSYSFRAKRNSDGAQGMVTAGHVIKVGQSLYESGVKIGTCSASNQSGSVDAAFVPINDPVTYFPSNIIYGTSDILSTETSLPGVGTVVNMRGQTTGYSSGTVLSTNASVTTTTGITYTNLTSANYTSAAGDSGGIIYTYVSSTNTRYTVGIHHGAAGSTRYFTKAGLALSTLGISRY